MKRLLTITLAGVMMSTALVGCGDNNENGKPTEDTAKVETTDDKKELKEAEVSDDSKEGEDSGTSKEQESLSSWSGDWNNMGAYLEKEEIQSAFETLAQKEGTTAQEEKDKLVAKRKVDFDGMSVDGEKITLYDGFKSEGANEIESAEYEYKGKEVTKFGKHDLEWSIFAAKDPDAKYKYFLMMPAHGEDGLKHFHFRYGNEEPEELLAKEDWFPTMVDPNSTTEQFIQEITE